MQDSQSKAVWAYGVEEKGQVEWMADATNKDIDNAGHKSVILKSDQEPTIDSLKRMVKPFRASQVVCENSAVGGSQSNGATEMQSGDPKDSFEQSRMRWNNAEDVQSWWNRR